ncbi:hypothetical protein AXF42_Ash016139 [Apostasia shenzhenica]|uniref:Uncharacterized protein n=1 Tax=Apostasia shenzhenica TaxID=1088818 RepID=A0A2I0AEJ2_9ASPA|nr:hypothetical protein AXF42_Ash016139 [Apostasia shenzhenica]
MWGSQETPKEIEFRETAARNEGVSLFNESSRRGLTQKTTRETRRDLRWFREGIPYVHRSISRDTLLKPKDSPEGLYNVFF